MAERRDVRAVVAAWEGMSVGARDLLRFGWPELAAAVEEMSRPRRRTVVHLDAPDVAEVVGAAACGWVPHGAERTLRPADVTCGACVKTKRFLVLSLLPQNRASVVLRGTSPDDEPT